MFFVEKNRDKWRVFLEKLCNFTKKQVYYSGKSIINNQKYMRYLERKGGTCGSREEIRM